MVDVKEEEKKVVLADEQLKNTAEHAFGRATPEEQLAEEAEKKAIDDSIAEARAAAQACLNSDLFRDYTEQFKKMEAWLVIRFRRIDAKSPSAFIEFVKLQAEMEVLGALMGSVKLDAGAKTN